MLVSLVTMVAPVVITMALVVTMVDLMVTVVYWHHYLEAMVVNLEALAGLVDTVAALVVTDQGGEHQGKDNIVVVINKNVTSYV